MFLWVHYMDVHHPYHPPEEHQLAFRDPTASKRESVKLRRKMLENPHGVTDEELQKILDLYDGEIRYFDAEMHRLIEGVREALDDDTVVAVTSDHGDEFGDHHGFAHYDTFYDELLDIPLLLDVDGNGNHNELVSRLDLAPTLLEYAGVDIPETFVGESLASIIKEDEWDKEAVIAESGSLDPEEFRCAYRTNEWKYIRGGNHRRAEDKPAEELYDLTDDPTEQVNLIDKATEKVSGLREAVDEHKQRLEATDRPGETVEIDAET